MTEEAEVSHACPLRLDRGINLIENHDIYRYQDCNFIKYFQISPDGNLILATDDENSVLTHAINSEVIKANAYYDTSDSKASHEGEELTMTSDTLSKSDTILKSYRTVQGGDSIYDAKWYPLMSRDNPNTNCFATSSKDHPIHLWDTDSCKIRASYTGYDQYDQLDSAYSLSFNLTGEKIFACTNRVIR
jgi:telomerase Cajal body protein 1